MQNRENENLTDEIVLEVDREPHAKAWLNRFCRDPSTHEIIYYFETDDNHKITIHRGTKDGPVIATANQCLEKDGTTDIHFLDPEVTVHLEHVYAFFPFFNGKTIFTVNGKKYHWKGHTALIEDDTGMLMATLHTKFFPHTPQKLGTLLVTSEGKKIMDFAVISSLVMQERSEEGSLATELARERFAASGLTLF